MKIYFFLLLALLTLTYSCDRGSCGSVQCPQNMACYNGQCSCVPGFEGGNCDIVTAKKYTGIYKVFGNCIAFDYISQINYIEQGPNAANEITITNFLNLGIDIKGFIDGTSISIPSQFTTSYDISGSGFYNPNNTQIDFKITYYDFTTVKTCDLKYVK
ncbi:MAG: hypothetical protein KA797_02885 [Chitinophagales bacterium]|nr:hypothetical protein [Chitinophagales bacterium]